jgi:hypothetical protein
VEAEDNCKKAIMLDSTNIRTKRILADILHCTNRHHEAHVLYAEILAAKIPKDKPVKIALQEMLGFHGDIVNSPIYALAWLKSDPMVTEDVWEWATYEFYYSPHFRSQHAYLLIQKGEHIKAFAKLYSLADEMPWYKEAVINSVNMMNQLGLDDPEMLAKKQRYEKIIRDNKWTFEGMHQL